MTGRPSGLAPPRVSVPVGRGRVLGAVDGQVGPEIPLDQSESRKATTRATSWGATGSPPGNSVAANPANASGSSLRIRSQRLPGMSIEPGETAFTRIPSGPSSRASDAARWICADLATPYWTGGPGFHPEIDEITTTEPPPAARRCGTAARTSLAAWPTFTSQVAAQSAASACSKPPPRDPPAQATTPSRPPKRFAEAATKASSRSGSVTSSGCVNRGVSSEPASAARPSGVRAQVATCAPSAASSRTICSPSPACHR